MLLAGCASLAGKPYIVIGSMSGATPTVVGSFTLPLVPDAYTLLTLSPGLALVGGMGVLDAEGRAQVVFQLPPTTSTALAGLELHHAGLVLDGTGQLVDTTGAARLVLIP